MPEVKLLFLWTAIFIFLASRGLAAGLAERFGVGVAIGEAEEEVLPGVLAEDLARQAEGEVEAEDGRRALSDEGAQRGERGIAVGR